MSDWGREPGRPARRGGMGGVLLFVFSLLFLAGGAALGLGLVPLEQFGVKASPGKDARIAQLQRELDQALNDRVSDSDSDDNIAVVIEQRDRLAGELANLKAQVARDGGGSDADAEMRQLQQQVERSEQKIAELTTSLNLAEGVIEDLQKAGDSGQPDGSGADKGNARLAELEAQLAQRDTILSQFDSEITSLSTSNDALKEERDRLQQEYSRVQGELAREQSRADQLQQQIISLGDDTKAATDSGSGNEAAERKIARLENELAQREAVLTRFDSEIERLNASNDALRQERDGLQDEHSQLQGDLAKAQARAQQLDQQRASLEDQLEKARQDEARSAATAQPENAEISRPSDDAAARNPRDPLRVASALAQAKGLGGLSETQRDAIATALIEGECVADTLAGNISRVPVLAMRDMIRLLEADC